MSLINEALKKAGRDAERAGPRATLAPSPSQVPPRRRSRRTIWLALLAIGGAALFLLVRGAFQGEAEAVPEPVRTAESSTVSAPDLSPATAVVETLQASTPVAVAVPEALAAPEAQPPVEAAPLPVERRRRRPRRASAPETSPVQAVGSALDGGSFLKRIEIPSGGSLELSGIAWSETQPVAVISGSVVSPGERVKGFKVLSIGPDSVDLEGANESFTLRLK